MPYVLHNKNTEQIFTCFLVNHYQLVYYGVKFWEDADQANEQFEHFLQEKEVTHVEGWEIVEMEEGLMKISNVRLKNDPNQVIYWDLLGKPELKRR
ncbi:hypothetical protein D3C73_756060 [compost metagenome]